MIDSILTFFFGSKKDRDIKQLLPIVEKVNAEESWAASLSETEVKEATKKAPAKKAAAKKTTKTAKKEEAVKSEE